MAGDDVKSDPAKPTEVAEALKNTRTNALKALNKAAAQLDVAIAKDQFSVTSDLGKLETAWKDLDASHKAFVQCVTEHSLDSALLTVNGKSADVWFSDAEKVYDTHVQMYKQHISSNTSSFLPPSQQNVSSPQLVPKSHLNFQRQEFPTWDGSAGKKWLEWKSAWQTEVEPYFGTKKLALAAQLRKCVKGEGIKEIQHVSLTDSKAYDTMWKALTDRFDNVALNIGVILAEFDSLKPVDSNKDHVGLLALIRSVLSAYEQLNTLGHVQQVDSFRVNALNAKLPFYLQEGWAEKVATMSPTERFHPFKEFVDFLKSKVDVVKAMVDISNDFTQFNSRKSANANATFASQACIIHEDYDHSLDQCDSFLQLSAREKADMCSVKGICKRCLQQSHEGPCDGDYGCTFCTGKARKSHCELLCFRKEENEQGTINDSDKMKSGQSSTVNSIHVNDLYAQSDSTCAVDNSQENESQKSEPHNVHSNNMYLNGPPFYSYPYIWPHSYMQNMNDASFEQQNNPNFCSPYFMGMNSMPYPFYGFHSPHIIPSPSSAETGSVGTNGLFMNNSVQETSNIQSSVSNDKEFTAGSGKSSIANNGPTSATASDYYKKVRFAQSAKPGINSISSGKFHTRAQNVLEFKMTSSVKSQAKGICCIYSVSVAGCKSSAVVTCDSGSEISLFTEVAVKRLNGKIISRGSLDIAAVSGTPRTHLSSLCEITLVDTLGMKHSIQGYTVPKLCMKPSQLDEDILRELFPTISAKSLQRPNKEVDIILGCDYYQLFAKEEIISDGQNLSVMHGKLGICLMGAHPDLVESTPRNPYQEYTLTYRRENERSTSSSAAKANDVIDFERQRDASVHCTFTDVFPVSISSTSAQTDHLPLPESKAQESSHDVTTMNAAPKDASDVFLDDPGAQASTVKAAPSPRSPAHAGLAVDAVLSHDDQLHSRTPATHADDVTQRSTGNLPCQRDSLVEATPSPNGPAHTGPNVAAVLCHASSSAMGTDGAAIPTAAYLKKQDVNFPPAAKIARPPAAKIAHCSPGANVADQKRRSSDITSPDIQILSSKIEESSKKSTVPCEFESSQKPSVSRDLSNLTSKSAHILQGKLDLCFIFDESSMNIKSDESSINDMPILARDNVNSTKDSQLHGQLKVPGSYTSLECDLRNQNEIPCHLTSSSSKTSESILVDVCVDRNFLCHSKCSHVKCCRSDKDDNDCFSNESSICCYQNRCNACESKYGHMSVKSSCHGNVSKVRSPVSADMCYGDARFVENKIKIQNHGQKPVPGTLDGGESMSHLSDGSQAKFMQVNFHWVIILALSFLLACCGIILNSAFSLIESFNYLTQSFIMYMDSSIKPFESKFENCDFSVLVSNHFDLKNFLSFTLITGAVGAWTTMNFMLFGIYKSWLKLVPLLLLGLTPKLSSLPVALHTHGLQAVSLLKLGSLKCVSTVLKAVECSLILVGLLILQSMDLVFHLIFIGYDIYQRILNSSNRLLGMYRILPEFSDSSPSVCSRLINVGDIFWHSMSARYRIYKTIFAYRERYGSSQVDIEHSTQGLSQHIPLTQRK